MDCNLSYIHRSIGYCYGNTRRSVAYVDINYINYNSDRATLLSVL